MILRRFFLPLLFLCAGCALALLALRRFPAATGIALAALAAAGGAAALVHGRQKRRRGWRVRGAGRDSILYEEWREGGWRGIEFYAELQTSAPARVIYLPPPAGWTRLPAWTHGRREEILARLQSRYPEPRFAYASAAAGEGAPGRHPA